MAPPASPPLHPTDPALAGQVIAGCELLTLLGAGGMGAVWKAHHQALDVPVAVKLLLPLKELEESGAERMLREARAAARLRHPNIVGVLNVGEDAGMPFLVMEFVEGESLQRRLDARGKLPLDEAVAILRQVLSALTLTFEHRIIHRDIKPENLLLDGQGRVKLVDLGLAKRVDHDLHLTQTGAVMGSPYYIAPEQASNSKAVDGRADLYALGCTFFHMLAGAPPYGGETYLEIILKHVQGPVADLAALDPSIPTPIVEITARLMATNPARRYQTPGEVLADLDAWAAGRWSPTQVLRPAGDRTHWRRFGVVAGGVAGLALAIALFARCPSSAPVVAKAPSPDAQPPSGKTPPPVVVERPTRPRPVARPSATARVEPPRAEPYRDERDERDEPVRPEPHRAEPIRPEPRRAEPVRAEAPRARGNSVLDALANRDNESLRRLLDRGASPNVQSGGMTPLAYATLIGDGRAVRMLLEKGANPNTQDASGETPLIQALSRGYRDMVSDLLDFGANPNVHDRYGRTPLQLAGGDAYFTRKLLEKGAH